MNFVDLQVAAVLMFSAASAMAQPYPNKPVRMIIPAGPGGGVDTISRFIGPPLSAALGQPIVMENRPGAGTLLASELTAKSPPDGYTLLMVTNSHVINAGIHKNLRYDPVNDFAQVTRVASVPYLVVVHPSVPAKSVKELIALAKRRPGQLLAASAGSGSGTHLASSCSHRWPTWTSCTCPTRADHRRSSISPVATCSSCSAMSSIRCRT